jgi:hypothetical protein
MLLIEIAKSDLPMFDQFRSDYPSDVELVETDQFDGAVEFVHLLVDLAPLAVGSLATILVQTIQSRKHVVVKFQGIEVRGISETNAMKVLSEYAGKKKK